MRTRTKRTAALLLPALALLAAFAMGGCGGERPAFTREQYRSAATALHQQQLYKEAVEAYAEYLRSPVITAEDAPKVLYQMGVIHQENLLDPRGALVHFTRLKALFPGENFGGQLGKRMVACLEGMGRSVDATAARTLLTEIGGDSAASAGKVPAAAGQAVVAEVDGRGITLGEVASLVGKLPESPLEVNQLVRQYVGQILVAEAAQRKGLAEKPEIRLRVRQFETQLLAQEGLKDEIKVAPPAGNDLKYYFEANKARYLKGPDSAAAFEAVAPKVEADWLREKQGAAYQAYVERLLQTAKVRFYSPGEAPAPKGAPAP